jgi:hypothetical protein
MSTTLACLIALSLPAAKEGGLEIVNARPTYGYLGAARPRTGVLPGEIGHFSFDVKNMKKDAKGLSSYGILVEGYDHQGKLAFKLGPHNATAQCYLGGDTLPCSAFLEIPPHMPPGDYVMKVTIEDRLAKQKVTHEVKGKVLPPGFGLVRVGTFGDRELKVPMPPLGVPGQSVYVAFSAVGFSRSKDGQPDLQVSLKVLDDKKQPTMPEPLSGRIHAGIPADHLLVPMQFGITLNRPGQYTIELNATDQVSGKTSRVTFPLRVLATQ